MSAPGLAVLLLSQVFPAEACQDPALVAADTPNGFDGSYNLALARARDENRPVLLAFLPDRSDDSVKLKAETLPDTGVAAELCVLVCLEVNADDPQGAQLARLHEVASYPVLVVRAVCGTSHPHRMAATRRQLFVAEARRIH